MKHAVEIYVFTAETVIINWVYENHVDEMIGIEGISININES